MLIAMVSRPLAILGRVLRFIGAALRPSIKSYFLWSGLLCLVAAILTAAYLTPISNHLCRIDPNLLGCANCGSTLTTCGKSPCFSAAVTSVRGMEGPGQLLEREWADTKADPECAGVANRAQTVKDAVILLPSRRPTASCITVMCFVFDHAITKMTESCPAVAVGLTMQQARLVFNTCRSTLSNVAKLRDIAFMFEMEQVRQLGRVCLADTVDATVEAHPLEYARIADITLSSAEYARNKTCNELKSTASPFSPVLSFPPTPASGVNPIPKQCQTFYCAVALEARDTPSCKQFEVTGEDAATINAVCRLRLGVDIFPDPSSPSASSADARRASALAAADSAPRQEHGAPHDSLHGGALHFEYEEDDSKSLPRQLPPGFFAADADVAAAEERALAYARLMAIPAGESESGPFANGDDDDDEMDESLALSPRRLDEAAAADDPGATAADDSGGGGSSGATNDALPYYTAAAWSSCRCYQQCMFGVQTRRVACNADKCMDPKPEQKNPCYCGHCAACVVSFNLVVIMSTFGAEAVLALLVFMAFVRVDSKREDQLAKLGIFDRMIGCFCKKFPMFVRLLTLLMCFQILFVAIQAFWPADLLLTFQPDCKEFSQLQEVAGIICATWVLQILFGVALRKIAQPPAYLFVPARAGQKGCGAKLWWVLRNMGP